MTGEEQVRVWHRYSSRALELAIEVLATRSDEVLRLAHQRFLRGVDEFGDDMFRMHRKRLLSEADEEGADLLNYLVAWLYQAEVNGRSGG